MPPFIDSGPVNVTACTTPLAPVASSPFDTPEMVRLVVEAFVAVITLPVNALVIKLPMLATAENKLLDDAVVANDVVLVAFVPVVFWNEFVPL